MKNGNKLKILPFAFVLNVLDVISAWVSNMLCYGNASVGPWLRGTSSNTPLICIRKEKIPPYKKQFGPLVFKRNFCKCKINF